MDRISDVFKSGKPVAVFAVAGFPDMEGCETALASAVNGGAGLLVLSVPFSDPMADPGEVADASRIAVEKGVSLTDVLQLAERLRKRFPQTVIVLRSYMNILHFPGYENLCGELARIGVDGLLPVDLVLEDRTELWTACRDHGISLIAAVSSLTPPERAAKIAEGMTGFLYFEPVPGAEPDLQALAELKKMTSLPVLSCIPDADGVMTFAGM